MLKILKKKDWLCLGLTAACLILLAGYRTITGLCSDTTKPIISFGANTLTLSVQDDRAVLLQGVSATDIEDGDVTASLLIENIRLKSNDGLAEATYAAFDSAGNVAKATREIRYSDYKRPTFTLTAPLLFSENSNTDVLDVISATDVLDGNIQHQIRATMLSQVSDSDLGAHDVEFTVTNSLGDTTKLVLPVEIYASGTYSANLTLTNYLVYLKAGDPFYAGNYLDSFTDGSKRVSLRDGLPDGYTLELSGEVDTQTPGIYCVDYTVKYGTPRTGHSKLIVIVEG